MCFGKSRVIMAAKGNLPFTLQCRRLRCCGGGLSSSGAVSDTGLGNISMI